jgi:hypothetical protein
MREARQAGVKKRGALTINTSTEDEEQHLRVIISQREPRCGLSGVDEAVSRSSSAKRSSSSQALVSILLLGLKHPVELGQ